MIFYEKASMNVVVLTDMIDRMKVVPGFLGGPITNASIFR
jgi:hypothetical protein